MTRKFHLSLIAVCSVLSCNVVFAQKQWSFLTTLTIADTAVFAPNTISMENRTEQAITFSKDGTFAVFSILKGRKANRNFWVLMQSEYKDGAWQQPVECPFSGVYSDYGPYFGPNDNSLYFTSRRPINGSDTLAKPDYDVWKVAFKNGIWGTPKRLANSINTISEEYSISVSNQHLFICAGSTDTVHRSDFFMISRCDEFNESASLKRLTSPPNSNMWEGGAYVDPKEKYIIFNHTDTSATANEDIYISFKRNHKWTTPQKLNNRINTPENEFMACVSAKRNVLFFSRNGQFYTLELSEALNQE